MHGKKVLSKNAHFHETAAVKDAVFLSDDALFMLSDFVVEMGEDKETANTNNGELMALMVREDHQWKYKRIIGMQRGEKSEKNRVQQAGEFNHSDPKALKIAAQMASQTAMQHSDGTFRLDDLAAGGIYYAIDGNTYQPNQFSRKVYEQFFQENEFTLGAHVNEAFFVAEDVIYAAGTWNAVRISKLSGAYINNLPGEYVQILRKEEGEWKVERMIAFRRGKPVQIDTLVVTDK